MSKNNDKVKSFFICLMLIMSGFLIAACSQKEEEDQHKTAIKNVIEHLFTGPDEKFIELMWNPKYRTVVNNKEENPELDKYIAEVYGPYMTDYYLNPFLSTIGSQYATFAHDNGYKLSLKHITINQSENHSNRYTFIAKVGYQKNDDEEKTANVEGEVIFSSKEEGKIEGFQSINDNGLADNLRTSN
ncbi:hypothetical protein E2K98_05470 [Bacillus salipaludis]|uniref:Uncharacterized protein n=1 Tax=Bacillus salipaludis TaxID=2547811 RepID=A0A4V3AU31_9BACI|nr:hypothetical protein [Bacillus salipaludis]MDQ6597688.1 hypothetical protein [Bacillus salipaludis]TDK62913.1 hypothetical protein E2K98_05470 [Bacillus salipaludis]